MFQKCKVYPTCQTNKILSCQILFHASFTMSWLLSCTITKCTSSSLWHSVANNKPCSLYEQTAVRLVGFGLSPCSSSIWRLPCSYATFYSNAHDFMNMLVSFSRNNIIWNWNSQRFFWYILVAERWCTSKGLHVPICRTGDPHDIADFQLYIWLVLFPCISIDLIAVRPGEIRLTLSSNPHLLQNFQHQNHIANSQNILTSIKIATMHNIIRFKILPFLHYEGRQFPQHYSLKTFHSNTLLEISE